MRRVLTFTAASALVATAALTGCSSSTLNTPDDCVASLAPGALSESVRISGDDAESLRVSLSQNTPVLNSQRSVTIQSSDRDRVADFGSVVSANVAYVDGRSGEVLEVSPNFMQDAGADLFLVSENELFSASLKCAAAGDLISVALSAQDSQAANYFDGELLLLAEVQSVSQPRATGHVHALPSGFPAVAVDAQGQPGVVMPPQAPPTEQRVAMRVEGDGVQIDEDNLVVGNVLTVSWDGRQIQNTWQTTVTSFGTEAQTQSEFRAALTGHSVGSQLVVIEPNDEGSANVHVIDILAAV